MCEYGWFRVYFHIRAALEEEEKIGLFIIQITMASAQEATSIYSPSPYAFFTLSPFLLTLLSVATCYLYFYSLNAAYT